MRKLVLAVALLVGCETPGPNDTINDSLTHIYNALNSQTTSIENLTTAIKQDRERMNGLDERLTHLETLIKSEQSIVTSRGKE